MARQDRQYSGDHQAIKHQQDPRALLMFYLLFNSVEYY